MAAKAFNRRYERGEAIQFSGTVSWIASTRAPRFGALEPTVAREASEGGSSRSLPIGPRASRDPCVSQ